MSIQNNHELAVTRKKLRLLEERVATLKGQSAADPHVRALTLRSLKSLVNQLREEIARYTAGMGARSTG
ncbi:MAG TPA: hypothetical protein DDY78_09655 [Planctomycetales bacterium]|jgi:hypothetical protein|nr:hypothetical protein [Planctomycetales bacterium]